MESMSGMAYFSKLDIRMAFHNIEVRECDQPKTAFICKQGTFSFRRMPFGLSNSPSTWCRAIDLILSGISPSMCITYLDDIVCFSVDIPTHVHRLECIFDRLSKHGLKLKPSKCAFFRNL